MGMFVFMFVFCYYVSMYLHLQVFEGMKAYKGEEGEIRLFRPMENMSRMLKSGLRLSLPVS